jgi:hypothetical protein
MRRAFVIAVLLCGLRPLLAFGADTDTDLSKKLVGIWAVDGSHRNRIDERARASNLYVIEEFDPDGNGVAIAYRGANCGEVVNETKFSWSVADATLLTSFNGTQYHDKITTLNDSNLVLFSVEQQISQARVKTDACHSTR